MLPAGTRVMKATFSRWKGHSISQVRMSTSFTIIPMTTYKGDFKSGNKTQGKTLGAVLKPNHLTVALAHSQRARSWLKLPHQSSSPCLSTDCGSWGQKDDVTPRGSSLFTFPWLWFCEWPFPSHEAKCHPSFYVWLKLPSLWDLWGWFELQCLHSYSIVWLRQLLFWNVATEGGSGPPKRRPCFLAFASVLTWTPHFFRKMSAFWGYFAGKDGLTLTFPW